MMQRKATIKPRWLSSSNKWLDSSTDWVMTNGTEELLGRNAVADMAQAGLCVVIHHLDGITVCLQAHVQNLDGDPM